MRARLTDFLVARPDRSGHWMASAFLIVLMGFVLQSGCSDQGAATKSVDARAVIFWSLQLVSAQVMARPTTHPQLSD